MDQRRGRYEAVRHDGHQRASASSQDIPPLPPPVSGRPFPAEPNPGRSPSEQSQTPSSVSQQEEKRDARKKRHTPTLGSFLLQWWQEFAALFLSIAFLVAVAVVLYRIDNTSLENWNAPWSIKPTTLLAILITFCKLCLLAAVAEGVSQLKWVYFEKKIHNLDDIQHFDGASRGALGSASFLLFVRWRAVIASVGAIVIILTIAMEPFTQQTLSFYNKAIASKGSSASVPRANNYDLNTQVEVEPYAGEMNSLNKKYYAPMLGAMMAGLYNPDKTVQFNCASSNCTWPDFQTLGICSSCRDVSDLLETHCQYHNANYSAAGGGGVCQYKTPGDGRLEAACYQDGGGSQSTTWNSTTVPGMPPDIITIAAISFEADDPALSDCAFDRSFRMPQPTATECNISWCAQTVRSQVHNGVLTENIISQRNLVFPKDTCNASYLQNVDLGWALNKFPYTNPDEKAPPDVSIFAAFLPDDVPRNMCADWRSQPNSAFWINLQDNANIGSLSTDIFTGPDTTAYTGDTIFAQLLYAANNGNLTIDSANMASSMSHQVRQGPNSTMHSGTMWTTETYIRVNWIWFAFPCGLVLLAVGFLVLTIIAAAHRHRAVWKSSSLALLFHGVQTWPDEVGRRSLQKTSEMKNVAKGLSVRLEQAEDGKLKLVTK